jgi:uncharacterized damage-inducible protein DinB
MFRAIIACLLALPAFAQTNRNYLPLDDYIKMWRISKDFTLEVAEKMPAEDYGFRPTPVEMPFGALMAHVAMSTVYRFDQMTGVKPPFLIQDLQNKKLTKPDITQLLSDSFDYVIELLPKITTEQMDKPLKVDWRGRPEATGRQMMLNMFTHVAHHRAQAQVYLRLKGIEPPYYTF